METKNLFTTQSYRMACALIANGFEFRGVVNPSVLSRRQYVFTNSENIRQVVDRIEEGKDSVASIRLYTANDFLTREVTKELMREEIQQEVLIKDKSYGN